MDTNLFVAGASELQPKGWGRLLLVKTYGPQHAAITDLIAQWVLRGPLYLIAAGEWLPGHDDLRYAVYRHTAAFDRALDHLILARPFTCLQLLDLLLEADRQNDPVLILDFLHLFYNPDVDFSLRFSTLEQCCQQLKTLSRFLPVAVLVPELPVEDYRRFYPLVASVADEILEQEKPIAADPVQGALF